MPENKATPSAPIRVLKLLAKIDWKAMALVLGALGGCTGAVWNSVDSWLTGLRQDRMQRGTYGLLSTRIDELYERVEVCEELLLDEPEAGSIDDGAGMPHPPGVAVSEEEAPVPVEVTPQSPPEPVAYKKARLPEYGAIQQAARDDLDGFMEEMKAR